MRVSVRVCVLLVVCMRVGLRAYLSKYVCVCVRVIGGVLFVHGNMKVDLIVVYEACVYKCLCLVSYSRFYILSFVLDSLRFIINHIAKPPVAEGKLDGWKEAMAEIAKYPNVFCKM